MTRRAPARTHACTVCTYNSGSSDAEIGTCRTRAKFGRGSIPPKIALPQNVAVSSLSSIFGRPRRFSLPFFRL